MLAFKVRGIFMYLSEISVPMVNISNFGFLNKFDSYKLIYNEKQGERMSPSLFSWLYVMFLPTMFTKHLLENWIVGYG